MARWEPDARGRLLRAAIDLFSEQGYEATTTAQIAARAGLGRATFFRHFPDKREVLFYGQGMLMELATEGIQAAPPEATPIEAIAAAVETLASAHREEQREYAPALTAVIAANEELQERAAFKHAAIAGAMASALRERGVEDAAASLAAELGARAYYLGFDRWIEPTNTRSFPEISREALDELRRAIQSLG